LSSSITHVSIISVKAKIITADLGKEEGIKAVKDALTEQKPQVKLLINAAGFGNFGTFEEISLGDAAAMIDVNCKATVLITHMTVPYMERGGRIINLGSGSCFTPLPAFNVYASSKSFVLHYTKALNFEIKKFGLRATCFCPGWVETEFLGKSTADSAVTRPKAMKPMLKCSDVVAKCIKASCRGKTLCVTNWYTKLQHLMFKALPDVLLTKTWMGMLTKPEAEEKKD
jgi:short-subunit dehydrogenase